MKKVLVITVAMLSLSMFASVGFCDTKGAKQSFDKFCASCHPNGGNIMNAQKTLSKKSMAARGIKNEKDIVAKMRNPGPGMSKFDAKAVPEKEATAIAGYVLKTFK